MPPEHPIAIKMLPMQKPTKFVLIGLALAAVLAGAAGLADYYTDEHLGALLAACNAQVEGRVCTATDKDIEDAITNRDRAISIASVLYVIALGIAILAVIPWTWYFLLRRLREVRDALTGR